MISKLPFLAADCPPPLVHYDCYRKRCEPTCSTLGSVNAPCPAEDGQCFPGCYCPEGKLRKGDECVTPTECRDCKFYLNQNKLNIKKNQINSTYDFSIHYKIKIYMYLYN